MMTTGKSFAAVFAFCVLGSVSLVSAQTQIQVEESTPSARQAQPNTPIEISIPGTRAPAVQLTTGTAADRTRTESGRIELTPAEFQARRSQDLPVTGENETTTASQEANLVPMQMMPLEGEVIRTTGTEESAAPDSAPDAGEATPLDEVQEQASQEESVADADDVSFLPPANLGKMETVTRGNATVPMLASALTPPSLEATIPDVSQTTLSNGMKFYHYESRDLPRVEITLLIDAGENADPADKLGLALLTQKTLRSGGAGDRSPDEVDKALDQIGAEIELSAEREFVRGRVFALTDRAEAAVEILADMLMRPRLNDRKFEQERGLALEQWRRRNDNPQEVSRREFRRIVYGPDYPLARVVTSGTLNAISLDDVRRFYEERYRPSSVWIGVSGDISEGDARQMVEQAFAGWDRPAGDRVAMPPAIDEPVASSGVYLTRRATAQSQVRMGHLGIERRSPKAYAVNVMNSVYGTGGFSSRLMNVVRTKHGFAYGTGGGVFSDDPVGLFAGIAATQPSTTLAAIREMLNVTREIAENGINEEELETARRDVIFTFVSGFQTPRNVVSLTMEYDFRGYTADYLQTFAERVSSVTQEEVNQVARELLQPDNMIIYVLGNPDEMGGELEQFGPVTEWVLEE